jgi:hypothetical protein
MKQRHHTGFFGVALALLALAGLVGSAYAMELESWDKKITNASKRFTVLSDFNNQAVLDKETGLVWEQSPDTTPVSWFTARVDCIDKNVGARKGWRLPSIAESASLVDPNAASAPFLPAGHPFSNIVLSNYWSATTIAGDPPNVWLVNFTDGIVGFTLKGAASGRTWCVRGGMNADQY